MIIDCISDLHGYYPEMEGGDLLILAGDLVEDGSMRALRDFHHWSKRLKYRKIIIIAGNHDTRVQICDVPGMPDSYDIQYLCDSLANFEGLKIWGSPWTKTFEGMNPKCKAFTFDTDEELAEKWELIPEDIDILVTHSPPHAIMDCTSYGNHVGSISLRNMVIGDRFPKLKLHVFGHIHEHGGKCFYTTLTTFVNASHVDDVYNPVHEPVRVIL
jgi:Icc-related predicted phosphoesterase